jgi:hypothetical protein
MTLINREELIIESCEILTLLKEQTEKVTTDQVDSVGSTLGKFLWPRLKSWLQSKIATWIISDQVILWLIPEEQLKYYPMKKWKKALKPWQQAIQEGAHESISIIKELVNSMTGEVSAV